MSPTYCSFSPPSYLFLIMLCLFLSVSSTVSLTHQFPSFIRQQSLVFPSLKGVCVSTVALEKPSEVRAIFAPCVNVILTHVKRAL